VVVTPVWWKSLVFRVASSARCAWQMEAIWASKPSMGCRCARGVPRVGVGCGGFGVEGQHLVGEGGEHLVGCSHEVVLAVAVRQAGDAVAHLGGGDRGGEQVGCRLPAQPCEDGRCWRRAHQL
jgi:hypothetical protein